ncbi:hypothetical protein Tco_1002300, partial [Tanacetum coccineum]
VCVVRRDNGSSIVYVSNRPSICMFNASLVCVVRLDNGSSIVYVSNRSREMYLSTKLKKMSNSKGAPATASELDDAVEEGSEIEPNACTDVPKVIPNCKRYILLDYVRIEYIPECINYEF